MSYDAYKLDLPKLTDEQRQANKEIHAHLLAAHRALERGDEKKAENNFISATQISEAAGIPHFGRYSLQQLTRRAETHKLREHERKFKERYS
jgi:hypothetical protein